MAEKKVYTASSTVTSVLFGTCDAHARRIEEQLGVKLSNGGSKEGADGDVITVVGAEDAVEKAVATLECLKQMASDTEVLSEQSVDYVIAMASDGQSELVGTLEHDVICLTTRGKPIKPKTVGQKKYVELIRKNTVIFGVGPAGTGKTFLAVAMAVEALRNRTVSRIILTRPAVEAGEKLGFLPGDLQSKIDPYLRPLYDALYEMLGAENFARQLEKNVIEIAPLAYMRGRTLDDSFIILDEAQNTTPEQMKMLLTRIGQNSKAVVNGDLSQTDLPFGKKSGLSVATQILKNIDGIATHRFTERDVVRHRLVQKIIMAYDQYERANEGARQSRGVYRAAPRTEGKK
ncbi:MAG: PhoH family protein [Clostridia bacterium]|nr:PhoH family protein [Clostridia bacterium]